MTFRDKRAFTLFEMLAASAILALLMLACITVYESVMRLMYDTKLQQRLSHLQVSILAAQVRMDSARSEAVFVWQGTLQVNSATFREVIWAGASPSAAPWMNSSDALAGLTAYYAGQSKTLTLVPAPGGSQSSCALFCGPDGRIIAYYELTNQQIILNGDNALQSTITRWTDPTAIGSQLIKVASYQQNLIDASLVQPGGDTPGPGAGRQLPKFEARPSGFSRVTMPFPYQTGALLPYGNEEAVESRTGQSWVIDFKGWAQSGL